MSHRTTHAIVSIEHCPNCLSVALTLIDTDGEDITVILNRDDADMLQEFFSERAAGTLRTGEAS